MKKMKKYISFLLVLVMTISAAAIRIHAGYSDIPANAAYADAVERMTALGVMDGIGNSTYKPDNVLSREQFLKIVVTATELADTAEAMMGETVFSDIEPKSRSSGYVNLALDKGFIKPSPDNKFNPYKDITFEDACAIVVRALGYTDENISRTVPDGFIKKAKELGLTEGINLRSKEGMPKWAVAVLMDNFWLHRVKNGEFKDFDRVFSGSRVLYTECVILGDAATTAGLMDTQVFTDKGTFYVSDPAKKLELGNTYRIITDGDTIIKASDKVYSVLSISVDNAVDTNITYKDGDAEKSLVLPNKIDYYYKGVKQNYEDLKNILQKNTSIIFTCNENKTGFIYAVICDPVYGKPEIAQNFVPSEKKLGAIDFAGNPVIIKNGEVIDISQILSGDVVCQVSDIWNKSRYILVTDKKAGGKVTAILPNKLSPKTIQIGDTNFDLSKDINPNAIVGAAASLKVGDNIILSLGHDGKIVDIHYPGSEDTSNYAFVINTSYDMSRDDSGRIIFSYYAKLLLDSGITATYKVTSDPSQVRGKIVRYRNEDTQTVELEQLIYNFPEESYINKGDRRIGESDVTDDVKIFDLVSEDGGDVQVRLLNWNDLPDGTIKKGKLFYSNKVGSFGDINVLLTNDILGEKFKSAVVKRIDMAGGGKGTVSYQYTLLVDGKTYEYTGDYIGAQVGSVEKVRMSGTGVSMILDQKKADVTGTGIQAMNGKKIQINNKVYRFKSNLTVYHKDFMNNITVKTLGDININRTYSSVSLYFGNNEDGKVEVIMLQG